jgi:hypothetical protein
MAEFIDSRVITAIKHSITASHSLVLILKKYPAMHTLTTASRCTIAFGCLPLNKSAMPLKAK